MQAVVIVFQIVAPVFILAACGFVWVKVGGEYRVQFVTRLAMRLSMPCLIFAALARTEVNRALLAETLLAAFTVHAVLALVMWGVVRFFKLDLRTFLAPLIFGNTGNLGLPLAFFAFGQTGLDIAIIVFAVSTILSFTLGLWIVSGRSSPLTMVREPMVWGILLGALFMGMEWSVPDWIFNTLELTGQMAIPLMLLTLGVAIARLKPAGMLRAVVLSAGKSAICISLAWAVASAFALPPVAFAILVLQLATPVAVTSYLIAESYGARSEEVAGLVFTSTLLSVAILPAVIGAFL